MSQKKLYLIFFFILVVSWNFLTCINASSNDEESPSPKDGTIFLDAISRARQDRRRPNEVRPPQRDGYRRPNLDVRTDLSKRDRQTSGYNLSTEEKALLDAINAARKQKGLGAVTVEEHLLCATRNHVQDVAPTGNCGHQGTDGSLYADRAKRCGYSAAQAWQVAEIGAGPRFFSAASVVAAWAQDPPHAKFLFHPQAKYVGVAVYLTCYYALFDCCVYPPP